MYVLLCSQPGHKVISSESTPIHCVLSHCTARLPN